MIRVVPFIPSNCQKCHYTGESNLIAAGPHVKQVCGNCGAYIKFYDKASIPNLGLIKTMILNLAGGSMEDISKAKGKAQFREETKMLDKQLQYWKLIKYFNDENRKQEPPKLL